MKRLTTLCAVLTILAGIGAAFSLAQQMTVSTETKKAIVTRKVASDDLPAFQEFAKKTIASMVAGQARYSPFIYREDGVDYYVEVAVVESYEVTGFETKQLDTGAALYCANVKFSVKETLEQDPVAHYLKRTPVAKEDRIQTDRMCAIKDGPGFSVRGDRFGMPYVQAGREGCYIDVPGQNQCPGRNTGD